jgi:hypothetical protein
MAYSKTTWANGTTPAISANNLNKIEQGIYESVEGKDALKNEYNFSSIGNSTFYPYGNFQSSGLNTDGSFKTDQKYRVSCTKHISFDKDIKVEVKSGFRWGYIPFVGGVAGTWSGWFLTKKVIPANTEFVVQIGRVTENTSEIADVVTFTSAITFATEIGERVTDAEIEIDSFGEIVTGYELDNERYFTHTPYYVGYVSVSNGTTRTDIQRGIFTDLLTEEQMGGVIIDSTDKMFILLYDNQGTFLSVRYTMSEEVHFQKARLFVVPTRTDGGSDATDAEIVTMITKTKVVSRNSIYPLEVIKDAINLTMLNVANGTPVNPSNTQCVRTVTHIPAKVGETLELSTNRPNTNGTRYIYGVYEYNSSGTLLYSKSPTDRADLTSKHTCVSNNVAYVLYAITEIDNGSTIHNLRITDFDGYYIYAQKSNDNNYDYDYGYLGEKIAVNKGEYNCYPSSLFSPSHTEVGSSAPQGFGIYNGKVIQFYTSSSKAAIFNFSDGTVIAEMDSNVEHGNSISFMDEFVDENDMFPIALASDGLTNKAYEIRIQESEITVRKTLKFPVENCGYYVSIMYDALNNVLYTVGYYANSYTSPTNNKMVIAKWDYSDITDNGDSTYTPAFVEKFYVPFFTTLQGPTFFNGKLFIISSAGGGTADTKIYVIDPYRKCVTNILNDFPSDIKTDEVEAIYFYDDGNGFAGYLKAYSPTKPYYKAVFN